MKKVTGLVIQATLRKFIFSKESTINGSLYACPEWYYKLVSTKGFGWVDEVKVSLDEWSWEASKGVSNA